MTCHEPDEAHTDVCDRKRTAAWIAEQLAARRNRPIDLPPPGEPLLLTLLVVLTGAEPEIWRRVEVRGDLTLDRVHVCLQAAMGWTDSHLHRFTGPATGPWNPPWFVTTYDEEELDESGTPESAVRLDQVLRAPGDWLTYIYDFGDDWVHHVEAEAVRPATEADRPGRCLDGAGACPPEDVGGIHTWNELAAALRANPDPRALRGELRQYAGWLPEGIAPDAFDPGSADAALARQSDVLSLPTPHPIVHELLARTGPDVRAELLDLLLAAHRAPVDPVTDEDWALLLRPWQTLLDLAHPDGIPLTAAGWISPAYCERLWHESGLAWDFGKGNREQHTPEVSQLREDATAARLIRRWKGRLVLTPLGRKAVRDQDVLRAAVAASLIEAGDEFDQHAAALTLLVLSGRARTGAEDLDIDSEVARLLTLIGWRTDNPHEFRYGVPGSWRVRRALGLRWLGLETSNAGYAAPAPRAMVTQSLWPSPCQGAGP